MGPVASQEAIKMFGTNGGGFFNANSAHPFENPNAFTNLIEMLSIFALGAGLHLHVWQGGGQCRNRAGRSLARSASSSCWARSSALGPSRRAIPQLARHRRQIQSYHEYALAQPGGNMEGKEMRFGIGSSTLFATITTDASAGAINSWHDSFTPLGGLVPLVNIGLGEIVFGGVGSGLYGLLMFAILAVFIAG